MIIYFWFWFYGTLLTMSPICVAVLIQQHFEHLIFLRGRERVVNEKTEKNGFKLVFKARK